MRSIIPDGVDAALELIGTPTLPDTLHATRVHGVVCFTGMLSNQWTVERFYPIEYLPRGVRLTAYGGDAADLPPDVLQDFLDAVAAHQATVPIHRVLRPRTDRTGPRRHGSRHHHRQARRHHRHIDPLSTCHRPDPLANPSSVGLPAGKVRGCRSEPPVTVPDNATVVDHVSRLTDDLLDGLELDRAALVGSSFGGYSALLSAAAAPIA